MQTPSNPPTDLITTTYSMWRLFRNCRRACEWRYIHNLVPLQQDPKLTFGALIHRCLEAWHRNGNPSQIEEIIDRATPNRATDEGQKKDWHLALAIMQGYVRTYPTEEFEVLVLEETFEAPIVNPESGKVSRTFKMAGRVDGVIRYPDGGIYLMEHKTAASIDESYLEKLWCDFQITLYAHFLEAAQGIKIAGILYNILGKAQLKQGHGETEQEFQARRADLLAKSKTGKTTAQRRVAETDDEFQARLAVKYTDPGMFRREKIYLSRDRLSIIRAELWELTQAYLEARRRKIFYPNTEFCHHWGRPCAYFPLCRADGSPLIADSFYQRVPPNEELRDDPIDQANQEF